MILREDYKSRDEVEGLMIFPKYHFKSQDIHSVMFPTTKSPSVMLYDSIGATCTDSIMFV